MTKYKTVLDKETGELKKIEHGQSLDADKPAQTGLTDEQLQKLGEMSREQLIALIEKVSKAGWGYGSLKGKDLLEMALKSKDEAYEALKLTALTLAVSAADWREFVALATFWSEREKGKPTQKLDGQVSIVQLVMEAAKSYEQPIDVTPSLPKKIEDQ
jgi:hypothetical protein